MTKSDWERLWHIKVHCEDVLNFIERFGNDFETFTTDRAYYNAVAMSIMQIGELANGLADEFRSKTADEVPWHKIRSMRNIFAHSYAQLDDEMVWETATKSVPEMKRFCEKYMNPEKAMQEGLSVHDILRASPPQNDSSQPHIERGTER